MRDLLDYINENLFDVDNEDFDFVDVKIGNGLVIKQYDKRENVVEIFSERDNQFQTLCLDIDKICALINPNDGVIIKSTNPLTIIKNRKTFPKEVEVQSDFQITYMDGAGPNKRKLALNSPTNYALTELDGLIFKGDETVVENDFNDINQLNRAKYECKTLKWNLSGNERYYMELVMMNLYKEDLSKVVLEKHLMGLKKLGVRVIIIGDYGITKSYNYFKPIYEQRGPTKDGYYISKRN